MQKLPFTFFSTWLNKFFECFVVFVFLRDLAYIYLPLDVSAFNTLAGYFETLLTGWNLIIVIIIVVLSLWWNREEELGKFNSSTLHEWLRLLICYYSAYLIFQYGLAKIYNNQFRHIYYRDDSLNGTLTGFAVAWSFFSYSYYFTLLIGILQLAGGVMLLFLKTRLAGAALLLPVMINILLINLFYGISTDAFVNAILISVALSYILWLQRRKLVLLLFNKRPGILSKRMYYLKAALRVIVILFAFTAGYPYKQAADEAFYTGKWKIVQLIRNGKIVDQQQWQSDRGIWNNVYIEIKSKLAFSANPNYYDYSKNHILRYQYKLVRNHLLLTRYPNMADIADTAKKMSVDSASVTIHRHNQNNMQWNAIIHGDTLQMELSRDTIKNIITGEGDLR
jgi:hypothetical protein